MTKMSTQKVVFFKIENFDFFLSKSIKTNHFQEKLFWPDCRAQKVSKKMRKNEVPEMSVASSRIF